MFSISLNLSSDEWVLIQQAARRQWPGKTLSRSEIIRRYTLVGITAFENASPDDRARLAHWLEGSMEAPDSRLRH